MADKDEQPEDLPLQNDSPQQPEGELPEEKKTQKRYIEDGAVDQTPPKKPATLYQPVSTGHDELPYELVLVRHGESEGNLAQSRSKQGDMSAYTPEFRKKHSSSYRLTDKGIMQAKLAGQWIRQHTYGGRFDRYYTSEYVRAMETASLLDLPDAQWYTEIVLRERDKGHLDNVAWSEKNERFSHEMALRKRDSFFWAPPGGESIAQICVRVDHTFNTMRRECSNKRVIIVCHGEVMWAFRVRVERLNSVRFHKLQSSTDKRDLIHNGTILHYTRVHPKTGEVYPTFRFMRSVCPWKPEYNSSGWLEFERPVYDNTELMASVMTVPRLVNNREDTTSDDD
jgi:NAD+ kinase